MDLFASQHWTAVPEPLPDSNLVMVRHGARCEVLIAQTKARLAADNHWLLDVAALTLHHGLGASWYRLRKHPSNFPRDRKVAE
jgi:hypothetical protein